MSADTKSTRVAVVTTSRADFGIYRPVLQNLSASPRIEPGLIATGMHLSPAFGLTISEVEASGFPVWAKPACMLPDEGVVAAAASAGKAVEVVGRALADVQPNLVMVLGDRYEMLAAALAANIVALPIAHIHGGEETQGANDNAFRHAITKLSHLHFAATPAAGDRILQMGEQPSSVFVVGAPALDVMSTTERVARADLLQSVGLQDAPFVLVALHPETLSRIPVETMIDAVWSAAMSTGLQILVTGANADVMGRTINEVWAERCAAEPRAAFVMSLGTKRFWSAMSHAAVMVGNSSSGIIEAASFHLPVVNIGDRQLGRERSGNVIDCGFEEAEIRNAISRATGDAFRDSLAKLVNVYGDGRAGARIRAALEQVQDPSALLQKKFHDYGDRTGSSSPGPGRTPPV